MIPHWGFRRTLVLGGLALLSLPAGNPVFGAVFGNAQAPNARRAPQAAPNGASPTPAAPAAAAASPQTPAAPQAPAPSAQPSLPPSMLNQPAKAAEIQFGPASLSIHAENSSLTGILQTISTQTGMKIEGLGTDERVFGNFGPGNPRDVITDLLNGTPYNVLMVGDLSNGAPRQLILTPHSPDTSPPPPPAASNETRDDAEETPNPNPQAIRTPQQLFQELQQMRERQQRVPP
jgi:hypothetical protein